MYTEKYIFAQIIEFAPRKKLNEYAEKYGWKKRAKNFSCWEQFLAMSFAQLSNTDSIRNLISCLNAHQNKLYHMGFSGKKIARKTLHDANEKRDWKIYRDFAYYLIEKTQKLYTTQDSPFDFELESPVYALDSSTLDLCMSLFPWAYFRKTKSAVKLHTLLNLNGNIPSVMIVTDGKVHDVNILDELVIEMGAFYVMDRAYTDFKRLYAINTSGAYFVVRAKKNFVWKRRYSHQLSDEEKALGISCDQTIYPGRKTIQKDYPEGIRRVKFFHKEKQKYLVFLTNNFSLSAKNIVVLYKQRWQIELFFKWVKQHLEIKKFCGYSKNAVQTQIWISVSIYLVVALLKKELKLQNSLYEILHILRVSLFDKTPLPSLFEDGSIQVSTGLFSNPSLQLG